MFVPMRWSVGGAIAVRDGRVIGNIVQGAAVIFSVCKRFRLCVVGSTTTTSTTTALNR
jgi:hypothetical protein